MDQLVAQTAWLKEKVNDIRLIRLIHYFQYFQYYQTNQRRGEYCGREGRQEKFAEYEVNKREMARVV
jgi:hypothetical protein